MALIFPASPEIGDNYAAPNGVTYTYDGEKWVAVATTVVGPTGPLGPTGPTGPENFEIDGGNASTIYTAEIEIDGGNANG